MEPDRNPYQAPAMPVRPRPRDIVLYNAWADRVGQPRWGAAEPDAAPVAAAPRRRPGCQGQSQASTETLLTLQWEAAGNEGHGG